MLFGAHVEPDGTVESHVLVETEPGELVTESLRVLFGCEVPVLATPLADCVTDTTNKLADRGLTTRGVQVATEILGHHHIGSGCGPIRGDLYVLLLKDRLACRRSNHCVTKLPSHCLIRVFSRRSEVALKGQAGCLF